MSSVSTLVECPHCKSPNCNEEFYYKTGELYILCMDCGYLEQHYYKRDKSGSLIMIDPEKNLEHDNLIQVDTVIENPYGILSIEHQNGVRELYPLEDAKEFSQLVASQYEADKSYKDAGCDDGSKVVKVLLKQFINNELKVLTLFDSEHD